MEERKSEEQTSNGTGKCECKDFQPNPPHPVDTESIRRLLKALEEELEDTQANRPTEATKKFGDDLKDADKEYQGIAEIVSKYEKFYDQLECKLAEARGWKEKLDEWNAENEDLPTAAIEKLREEYEAEEKKNGVCCKWLEYRDRLNKQNDCLAQATRKEEEAKDDNEAYKGFEKTLSDRFAELKTLFDKAGTLHDAEKHKSVYAVSLEFDDVYKNLGKVITWEYRRKRCNGNGDGSQDEDSQQARSGARQGGQQVPEQDLKKQWTPENLRTALTDALRKLIRAKYQRFRWQQQRLETESDSKRFKDACDKFRKTRRDEFIQEAEDIPSNEGGSDTSGAQTDSNAV